MQLGLIGAGRWGKRYIETIRAMDGVRITHLASRNPACREWVAADCAITAHWSEVAQNPDLDGVIVATPPGTHLQLALAAIHAGRPVLVEKPMTLSTDEAQQLVKAASEGDVLTMVDHTHLFSAAYQTLKRIGADLGPLCAVRSIGCNWGPFRPDTPALWDWGPHDVAMCVDLFGGPPQRVAATRLSQLAQPHALGESIHIALEYPAATAHIEIGNLASRKQRLFEARYARGILVYDDLAPDKLTCRVHGDANARPVVLDRTLPLTNVVTAFCEAIASPERGRPSLQLALQVTEILAACEAQLLGNAPLVSVVPEH